MKKTGIELNNGAKIKLCVDTLWERYPILPGPPLKIVGVSGRAEAIILIVTAVRF
jgi:hypothetical protein